MSVRRRGGVQRRFKELRSYYFHNCVYGRVYEDAQAVIYSRRDAATASR